MHTTEVHGVLYDHANTEVQRELHFLNSCTEYNGKPSNLEQGVGNHQLNNEAVAPFREDQIPKLPPKTFLNCCETVVDLEIFMNDKMSIVVSPFQKRLCHPPREKRCCTSANVASAISNLGKPTIIKSIQMTSRKLSRIFGGVSPKELGNALFSNFSNPVFARGLYGMPINKPGLSG